jgi:hypothetical protein
MNNPPVRELLSVGVLRKGTKAVTATLGTISTGDTWEANDAFVYRKASRQDSRTTDAGGALFTDDRIIVSFRNPALQVGEGATLKLPDGRKLRVNLARRYKLSLQCDCEILKPVERQTEDGPIKRP